MFHLRAYLEGDTRHFLANRKSRAALKVTIQVHLDAVSSPGPRARVDALHLVACTTRPTGLKPVAGFLDELFAEVPAEGDNRPRSNIGCSHRTVEIIFGRIDRDLVGGAVVSVWSRGEYDVIN